MRRLSSSQHPPGGAPTDATRRPLEGLVADAQTYAAACKAIRLLLDETFHTVKVKPSVPCETTSPYLSS